MATKKPTTRTTRAAKLTAAKPVEASVETVVAAAKEPVEAAVAVGKETVEAVAKAGAQAASAGYEKAAAIATDQVDKTSKVMFKGYGDFASLGQDNVEAVIKSGNIAAKGFEALGREMMAYARYSLEGNVAATKAILGAKSLREVVDLQNEYTRKSFDHAMAESAKLTEMSVKVANEAIQPIQARVNVTVGKMIKPVAA